MERDGINFARLPLGKILSAASVSPRAGYAATLDIPAWYFAGWPQIWLKISAKGEKTSFVLSKTGRNGFKALKAAKGRRKTLSLPYFSPQKAIAILAADGDEICGYLIADA